MLNKTPFTVLPVLLCLNAPVFAAEKAPAPPPPTPAAAPAAEHPGGMGEMHEGMMKGMMKGGKMPEMMEHRFKEMDANGDGKLSLEEMQAHTKSMFEKMDADKDGSVTLEEMRAHHKAMHEMMREKMHKDAHTK